MIEATCPKCKKQFYSAVYDYSERFEDEDEDELKYWHPAHSHEGFVIRCSRCKQMYKTKFPPMVYNPQHLFNVLADKRSTRSILSTFSDLFYNFSNRD